MGPYKPIPGNRAGSYLTAFSLQGFYSNINGIIIGLVQIFADQSYWQSAVAASPIHAVKVTTLLSSHTCTATLALPPQEEKKERTTPLGVKLMTSQVIYW